MGGMFTLAVKCSNLFPSLTNSQFFFLSDMTSPISSRLLYKIFIKLVFILPLFCQHVNLVIGGDVDDDSLENALEAIERRQRDLQMRGLFVSCLVFMSIFSLNRKLRTTGKYWLRVSKKFRVLRTGPSSALGRQPGT